MKRSAILGWALITLINLSLLVVVALVFLRFAPPQDSVTPIRAQLLATADKDVVMRFRPNLRDEPFLHHQPFTVDLEYPQIRLSTNGLGFRDVEHAKTKDRDTVRVVLAGDSYMFATNMDQENTPRDQLQRGLNEVRSSDDSYHYEVFNFGLPGLNLEGMVRVNQRYALEYEPDIILYSHICDDLSSIDVSTWYSWVQTWRPRLSFLPQEVQGYVLGPALSGIKELLYKIDDFWEYRTSGYIAPDAESLARYKKRMQTLLLMVQSLKQSHDHEVYFLDYCGYPPFEEVLQKFNLTQGVSFKRIDLTDIELDHTEHPTIAGIDETVKRLVPTLESDAKGIIAHRQAEGLSPDGQCTREGYAPPSCLQCLPERTGERCARYRFDSVSCGGHHCCAHTKKGEVRCWGAGSGAEESFPHYGQASPPEGLFKAVSAGLYHSCAIQKNGQILCWGRDQFGESQPPSGQFTALSVGDNHGCGIRIDKTLHCWGEDQDEKLQVPHGQYQEISVGGNSACARSMQGDVKCWGRTPPKLSESIQKGWHKITSGRRGLCALSSSEHAECTDDRFGLPPDEEMLQIDASGYFSCGVTSDHRLLCWGPEMAVYHNPPAGLFEQVDVGLHHACALNTKGALHCWGHDGLRYEEVQVPKPEGS